MKKLSHPLTKCMKVVSCMICESVDEESKSADIKERTVIW